MSSMRNIRQELGWIIRLMESVSAKPGRSNGAVRWRLKLIEDELRALQRRVRKSRRPDCAGMHPGRPAG